MNSPAHRGAYPIATRKTLFTISKSQKKTKFFESPEGFLIPRIPRRSLNVQLNTQSGTQDLLAAQTVASASRCETTGSFVAQRRPDRSV